SAAVCDVAISGHGHVQALGCSPPVRLLRCARNDRVGGVIARSATTWQSRAMGTFRLWVAPQPLRLLRCARNDRAGAGLPGALPAVTCSINCRVTQNALTRPTHLAGPAQRFASGAYFWWVHSDRGGVIARSATTRQSRTMNPSGPWCAP